MKRFILFLFISIVSINFSFSQDWMTSIDVAKRLALVQNKMMFVIWEEALLYPYKVSIKGNDEVRMVFDLSQKDEEIDQLLWEYFIPVILSEDDYDKLYANIKGKRSANYIDKFNDDSIKIMDVNGNILNMDDYSIINFHPFEVYQIDLKQYIENYALNTKYINPELMIYSKSKTFVTSYNLGSKLLDFSIFSKKVVRKEIIGLANIYLDESKDFLKKSDLKNKPDLYQKLELLKLKELLILENPKKTLRQLKRINESEVAKINENLYAYLFFTVYRMIGDEKRASSWRNKVSLVDLKKSNMLVNNKL